MKGNDMKHAIFHTHAEHFLLETYCLIHKMYIILLQLHPYPRDYILVLPTVK